MHNSQYEVLRPFVTARINQLAKDRLLNGLKFHNGHTLKGEFDRSDVKAALLLVTIANPSEFLTGDERDILNGRQMQSEACCEQKSAQEEQKSASAKKRKKLG